MRYWPQMFEQATCTSDYFLASTADLVNLLAHFAGSSRRHSSQHRHDHQLVQSVLSTLLPEFSIADQLPALTPSLPAASPVPAPRTLPRDAALTSRQRNPVEAKHGPSDTRRRPHCQCGNCKWCVDNARWDRVFNEKFADPNYYGGVVVRHNSTLAEAR